MSKDKIAAWIVNFMKEHGINPVYGCTFLGMLVMLSFWRDYENWDNVIWQKN
jgi:hypothetical protein